MSQLPRVTLLQLLALAPLVKAQDSPCAPSSWCTSKDSCQWYQDFLSLRNTDLPEYKRRRPAVRRAVCNRPLKKVCCPLKDNSSPGWVPLASEGDCGNNVPDSAFVIGGENTELGEMPWTALLRRESKWICGGAVINKWYVLTAAHCNDIPITKVRLGEWRLVPTSSPISAKEVVFSEEQRDECGVACRNYDLADGTRDCSSHGTSFKFATEGVRADCGPPYQEFSVKSVEIHPKYKKLRSNVVIYDLALVKLSGPVTLKGEGPSLVSPICLPLSSSELVEDEATEGTVTGWGTIRPTGTKISIRQKKLKMPLVGNTQCGNLWLDILGRNLRNDLTEDIHLCAGGVDGQDSCRGDSGGPFIIKKDWSAPYTLAGVVSFGTSKCGIGVPAICTRVAPQLEWIKRNLV